MRNVKTVGKAPSGLEQLVMEFLWAHGPSTAEQVRDGLRDRHAMKEATARTILRRLEAKEYATHRQEGRTYVYSGVMQPEHVAMRSIRQIINRFWGGSAQALVAGMVEQEIIDPAELRELARRLRRPATKQQEK
jgi:BlaI family penicillinase repressor